jgi:acyl transferase domain-containing protein
VNSFGLGGSNAHAVLDDALHFLEEHRLQAFHRTVDHPPTLRLETNGTNDVNGNVLNEHEASSANPSPPTLLSFSAFDDTSLKRLAMEYKRYFGGLNFHSQHEFKAYLADLAHTLNTKRSTLPARSHLLATKLDDLQNVELISSSVHQPLSRPVLAFAFTGQGAQWEGMGQELFSYPIFARRIQELDTYLKNYGSSWSLRGLFLCVAYPERTPTANAKQKFFYKMGLQISTVLKLPSQPIPHYRLPWWTCSPVLVFSLLQSLGIHLEKLPLLMLVVACQRMKR